MDGLVFVLIETYWNVNMWPAKPGRYEKVVLIETYWNVNEAERKLLLFDNSY